MRHVSWMCALALVAGAASAQQPATRPDSVRLTRRQAIAEALSHNAQIEIAREQTSQARARRITAISIPDPALTGAYDQLAGPFAFNGAPSTPVSLGLTIPFPHKTYLNNRIGTADIRNFEFNQRLRQQLVAFTTSTAYDSLLVAQRHYNERRETVQLTTDFLKRTQARFDAGSAPRLDVIRAQVDAAQSENDLVAAERAVALAQASLNRQLGRTITAPIAPLDSLDVPPPLPDSVTIETVALANRPELRQLEAQQSGAAASTSLTKSFWMPDLTFAVQRDYAQPGEPLFTTGLALPLPVFLWQHTRGDIAQATHFERELAATYRDARAQVTQDVRQAYATASTAIR